MKLRTLIVFLLCAALAASLFAQRRKSSKKDEEPPTQVLPPLPEPPDAVSAETARLSFQVSPLSSKGLLSQQVRDALKALMRDARGAQIVKLRAFVAGSGDLRRVAQIAAEEFSDRKQSLPAVSTIQVGSLPMVGAQVLIEAASVEKKPVNPHGLAFFSAVAGKTPEAAAAAFERRYKGAALLRLTCFVSSLDDAPALRTALGPAHGAIATIVQTQRQAIEPQSACEGVSRLDADEPQGFAAENGQTTAAYTAAPKLILTGTKLVFRAEDSDIRLALERLGKAIEPLGADSHKDVIWTGVYPLTKPLAARVESLIPEFFGPHVAGSSFLFEGLPSIDATAAVELIAASR